MRYFGFCPLFCPRSIVDLIFDQLSTRGRRTEGDWSPPRTHTVTGQALRERANVALACSRRSRGELVSPPRSHRSSARLTRCRRLASPVARRSVGPATLCLVFFVSFPLTTHLPYKWRHRCVHACGATCMHAVITVHPCVMRCDPFISPAQPALTETGGCRACPNLGHSPNLGHKVRSSQRSVPWSKWFKPCMWGYKMVQ